MVTNEEYEKIYLIVRKIVCFVNYLTDEAKTNNLSLYLYLKSVGYVFDDIASFEKTIRVLIYYDILNCHFLLGYKQKYNSEDYFLFNLVDYSFYSGDIPWNLNTYLSLTQNQANRDFFSNRFEIFKNDLDCFTELFPVLYIELSKVNHYNAEKYISILQQIVVFLSKKQNAICKQKDERIDTLLSNPQSFLEDLHEDKDINPANDEIITDNNDEQNDYDMELLKDKLFNGISFEVLKEEYHEGYSNEFFLLFRISNYNDHKKKIRLDIRYISVKHGLKKEGYILNDYVPDNSFVDVNVKFEDITSACNGDRMELDVNEGKFASLRLVRERNQWMIVESIERNTYNRDLKNKIEHFEAIEEQYGITLQNFSVKMRDENSLDLFCEVLALDGKVKKSDFTIEAAIYDSDNDIVYHTSLSSHDFKGFEVYSFGPIRLDITVDEISKIRIYPIR